MEIRIILITIFFVIFLQIQCNSKWWENSKTISLTSDNFFNVVGHDKYVIVKFFTKWCYYCQKLSPVYEKVVEHYKEKRNDIVIARLECGDNEFVARQYYLPYYPTIALFYPNDTKIKYTFEDDRSLKSFVSWIDEYAPKLNQKKNEKLITKKCINPTNESGYLVKKLLSCS